MDRHSQDNRKQYWLNMTLAGLAGQVGCVTLVIVLGATIVGLWLDSHFQTRPTFTLILILASIPVSVLVMLFIVRRVIVRIKAGPINKGLPEKESPESYDHN